MGWGRERPQLRHQLRCHCKECKSYWSSLQSGFRFLGPDMLTMRRRHGCQGTSFTLSRRTWSRGPPTASPSSRCPLATRPTSLDQAPQSPSRHEMNFEILCKNKYFFEYFWVLSSEGLILECRVSILSIILCNWLCKWILNEFGKEAYSGWTIYTRKRFLN